MAQLVGRRCVACRQRIGWVGDSRFCPACGDPVHNECAMAAVPEQAPGACPECGGRRRRESALAPPGAEFNTRTRRRRLLIAILAVALVSWAGVIASVFVILMGMTERVKEANRAAAAVDRASAGREGEAWTLNELFSYLEAKGAVSSMVVVESGRDELPAEWVFKTADNRTVRVRRLDDAGAAARDARGRQGAGFSWGRFSFVGDPVASDRFHPLLHE